MTDNFYLDSNPETFNLQLPTCKRISTTILTQLLSHLLPQCLSTPQQPPPLLLRPSRGIVPISCENNGLAAQWIIRKEETIVIKSCSIWDLIVLKWN